MTASEEARKVGFPSLPRFTIPGLQDTRMILPIDSIELKVLHAETAEEPFWKDLKPEEDSVLQLDNVRSFCLAVMQIPHEKSFAAATARHILHFFVDNVGVEL